MGDPAAEHALRDHDAAVDVYEQVLFTDDVCRIRWGDGETVVWVRADGIALRSRTDPGGGVGPESTLALSTLAGYLGTADSYGFVDAKQLPATPAERRARV